MATVVETQTIALNGGRSARPSRRLVPWIGTCIALFLLGACGLRNDPLPLTTVIQPTDNVQARMLEKRLLVSWTLPSPGQIRLRGTVQAYELIVRHLPLVCSDCRTVLDTRFTILTSNPDLVVENQTAYYPWKPNGPPQKWLVQVQTHFQFGDSDPGKPVSVEGTNDTPVHSLLFQTVETSHQVRLYWKPVQERVLHVRTDDGFRYDRVMYYRANVYRRFPPAPWPFTPLNRDPDENIEYLVQPPAAKSKGGPDYVEYTIRLVDQFGNEGPAAAPLVFGAPSGGQG